MRITKFELLPESDLLVRLRTVRLRGFDHAQVYRDSHIQIIRTIPVSCLPAQRYVLRSSVNTILRLAYEFAFKGVDIFDLRGVLLFWLDGQEDPIPLLPPIIEESPNKDGGLIYLINDGIHRIYAANELGVNINVVAISRIPKEYPYYAYPLQGGWSAVEEIHGSLPMGYERKEYRNPDDYKALFRDFNEVFPGVQKKRI